VIVLGYGDLTEAVLDELELGGSDSGDEGDGAGSRTGAGRGTRTGSKVPFVVVATESQAAHVRESGRDVLVGTPSDEEPLRRASIERARAVVAATENDAEDAFSILTARELNPEIRIVAAATDRENVPKLKRAGADTVISPAVIGGRLLVRSALGERSMEALADRIADATDADGARDDAHADEDGRSRGEPS
jgi:voltage-gated potassium channel